VISEKPEEQVPPMVIEGVLEKGQMARLIEESIEHKAFLGDVARVDAILPKKEVLVVSGDMSKHGLAPRSTPTKLFEKSGVNRPVLELKTLVRDARLVKESFVTQGRGSGPTGGAVE